tara:strand:- start:203 stop:451 length:249 start_codon:yes stop_codon:yes gene_type:complete
LKIINDDDDYYGDYPFFKKNIIRWNDACDIMGIKQCLFVLRFECKWKKGLDALDEQKWNHLFRMLTKKYHQLVKRGKIDAKV